MSAALRSVLLQDFCKSTSHTFTITRSIPYLQIQKFGYLERKIGTLKTALTYGISPSYVIHLLILIGLISANKSISLFPSLLFSVVFCKDICEDMADGLSLSDKTRKEPVQKRI